MPKLKWNSAELASFLKVDPSGALHDAMKKLERVANNMASQGNLAPIGKVEAPPQITAINAVAGGGVHHVVITDSNPVRQGIIYHFEWSPSPNFPTQQTYLAQSGPSRSLTGMNLGPVTAHWRGFSQYPGGPPSKPVYFGTQISPTPVTASGATVPSPPSSTGSGNDNGLLPVGGQGFGPGVDQNPNADSGSGRAIRSPQ